MTQRSSIRQIVKKKLLLYLSLSIAAVILVLAICPYKLVASPNSKLRIVDDSGQPLVGMRVVRQWDTSEGQKGEDLALTDNNGAVNFKRVEFNMSWLKRITKPLLIFVPASCGPGWEVYGHAEFDIYWPDGYILKFDNTKWKKVYATFENRDGIHIYDSTQAGATNYVGLYIFNKREDFQYTLTVYRHDKI